MNKINILSEEHKRKISESIKKRWKEGKQKLSKKCPICSGFISKKKEHNCEDIKEKQRKAKLENPSRYWLGKKRDKQTIDNMQEGRRKYINGKDLIGEKATYWKGGCSNWWHDKAREIMAKKLGRKLESNEIFHHRDGNYKNNDIDNLVMTTRKEHIKIHNLNRFKREVIEV